MRSISACSARDKRQWFSIGVKPMTPKNPAKPSGRFSRKTQSIFNPNRSSFMMNFVVEDLEGLLEALRKEGVEVDPRREDYDYGRFAWIMDPEGNRIELWEPPKAVTSDK